MFKILKDYCTPKRGTKYSAYVDLFSAEDVTIGAGETKIVKLGVELDLDKLKENKFKSVNDKVDINSPLWQEFLKSHYLEVALRSSLGIKGLIIELAADTASELALLIVLEVFLHCNR